MYQGTRIQTHHRQTRHQKNLIRQMIAIIVNQLKINAIRRRCVRNTRNRTRQNRRRAIMIRPAIVTTDASNVKKKSHHKKDPIKLCAHLTEKLLRTDINRRLSGSN